MSFKIIVNKIKSNFWTTPALYGACSFLLAILSMMFDRYLAEHTSLIKIVPSVFLTDKELAHTILSAISTSLLTMTTITFSSVLVVQTTFLAQFSPRALQNFNTNSKTQQVLGTFIGGYIYSLVLLIQVRDNELSNMFIVPSFAILVAFICLGMFVFLIHHIMDWIKVGNLISNITKETLSSVKKNRVEDKRVEASEEHRDLHLEKMKSIEIKSKKRGYVQYVELLKLVEFATETNMIIKLEKAHGNYVDVDTALFTVWNSPGSLDKNQFLHFISITADQESVQDVEFGIQKLAEIALRAIAPGKNDPETAINCIEQLAQILAKIGMNHSANPYYCDRQNNVRIILKKPTFTDYLYESFYQIRHYGKADVSVMASIIKALTLIAETNKNEIKDLVWDFSDYIVEGIKNEQWLGMDKKFLNSHLSKLANACNHNNQVQLLQ
ncbi:DUF2254 domain-containing protein [Peribacillus cavernae]|uniref:DUF2254 domain-containing protein n=1 Tax=Peribacillus cavernae TaxID=1674310 RepID=A0A433HKB8_9BACI|nr:DUF2254 domain-containing protein [Peribacillus cavernae]MDQ0220230.1 putative membrane protein [Peribacillus cavernae]RUQ28847.1 DUF2254 domain-containing protein [Peribacillus cavernae]